MKIYVAAGTGEAPTALSAFDVALNNAGVANYNLLRLSSVIPPASEIIVSNEQLPNVGGAWGDKLYVVMAEMRVDAPNTEAWAGIGWVQDSETGKGLFVEHEGLSEQKVRDDITQSLQQLMKTRNVDFGEIYMMVQGVTCHSAPVCAMVVAAYQHEPWRN